MLIVLFRTVFQPCPLYISKELYPIVLRALAPTWAQGRAILYDSTEWEKEQNSKLNALRTHEALPQNHSAHWLRYVNMRLLGEYLYRGTDTSVQKVGARTGWKLCPGANHYIHIKLTLYELALRQDENHDNIINCRKKRKSLTLRSLVKAYLCLCHCWQSHPMARHTEHIEET